jgi:hypothetical protein
MDLYAWISLMLVGAFYGVPFAVGLCVSSLRRAMLLAMASFAGLYASIWSTLGPLFLPLAAQLVTRYELSAILLLSFLLGAVQATALAVAGFAFKRLVGWSIKRLARPDGHSVAMHAGCSAPVAPYPSTKG